MRRIASAYARFARELFSGPEQFFNRAEPVLFLLGRRLGAPGIGRRRQFRERGLRESLVTCAATPRD
jgi:hypothetical protein